MPASEQAPSLPREADAGDSERRLQKEYAMNGLLIEDREILSAMDPELSGVFLPVALKKDGDFTAASRNSLVNAAELARVNRYLGKLIRDMATELHAGHIEARPLEGSCDYCAYRGIRGGAEEERPHDTMGRDAVLAAMEQTEEEN